MAEVTINSAKTSQLNVKGAPIIATIDITKVHIDFVGTHFTSPFKAQL
jgi:hypothetical protein